MSQTLGHKITPEAEWPSLWRELKDRYADKTIFVPTLARYVIAWNERLIARLESDSEAAWTEELLSVLSEVRGGIKLNIEVSHSFQCMPPAHIFVARWTRNSPPNHNLEQKDRCLCHGYPKCRASLSGSTHERI